MITGMGLRAHAPPTARAATGLPTRGVLATWVLAPTALVADGIATALFFDADPDGSTFTEGAAIAVADADLVKLVGVVKLTSHTDFASGSISMPAAKPELHFIPATTSLWAVIVARGTLNLGAVDDVKLKVDIERQ